MRFGIAVLAALACASFAQAQQPLDLLPYTPSLDRQFLDTTADPCVDFYRYACGNWSKLNPMPADEDRWDVYRKLTDENERFLWGLLLQAARKTEGRTANEQKIGDYFSACMNTAAIGEAGTAPIEHDLGRIGALHSTDDIALYVAGQHKNGIDGEVLFSFSSGQQYSDSTRVIAFVNAGGLGLPDRDYYTKTDPKSAEIRARYLEHVAKMLQLIGESAPDARTDAAAVMEIETGLAKASLTRVEKRNPHNLDHLMRFESFSISTPAFDWDTYFKTVGKNDLAVVNVSEPKFLEELNELLKTRPMAEWRAYFRWHLVNSRASYLSAPFDREDFDFFGKYLTGTPEQAPRWKRCTRWVDRDLGEALGQVFVARTFKPETKQEALTMTDQIEKEMGDDIHQLNWMSDRTKQQALLKLKAIVNKIGYPSKWRDYGSVRIVADNFAEDVAQAASFETRRDLAKIGKPLDRSEWLMSPPTVNAYYDEQLNAINFPAGVLQPPLFDPKMDAAPNYGNTGATIGHELTHGFDDEGRMFDAQGNLRDWWTPGDAKAFEQRISCVQNQYAQYTVIDDLKINSKLTSGEDVADLGGTLLAYLAWKHASAGKGLEPIDGFTPDQRFFIGMAQWACGEQRPESERLHATVDPHSPDEFRINGVVSDLPEFGHAFSCKPGRPMMSVNACRVW